MTTSLTRELLLNKAKPKYEEIDLDGFGTIGIRSVTEFKRTTRASAMFKDDGSMNEAIAKKRRVYGIIDQVMVDESTPMFTDDDVEELMNADSYVIDKLYYAIQKFNGEDVAEKKGVTNG